MNTKRLVGVLFIAAVLAGIIRTFVFETIRVTTPAMSENQSVGNRLMVEKWSIGARLPLYIGIPFTSDTLFGKKTYFLTTKKGHRLPGFGRVKRNDLLAFNCPITDQNPIDKHPILLSRCVGLPGEYIHLKGARLFINDEEIQRYPDVSICYQYPISSQEAIANQLEANQIGQKMYQGKDSGFVYLTRYQYYTIAKRQRRLVLNLKPCLSSFDDKTALIPYKGFRIQLNDRTFKTWGELINRYEGIILRRIGKDRFKKNGNDAEFYIFKQDYYWLLNDHQGYLDDSRRFGLIPESHVIGKACLVLFSPKTRRLLQKI